MSTVRTMKRSRGRQYPARPGNRKRRSDALPELTDFTDEGCEFSPSCLRCPLERCRYDEPGGARQLRRDPRDEAIRVKRAEGVDINALAAEYGLTRRSVFRILAEGRCREGDSNVFRIVVESKPRGAGAEREIVCSAS